MSTTWDEASKCPRDGAYTGIVKTRKTIPGQGQLVELQCPEDHCPFHETGWIVQVRPDGTIPDKAEVREKQFPKTSSSETRRRAALDLLEEQVQRELRQGKAAGR